MMIAALQEALAQAPGFSPELTVIGTTSGGMTFGEQYYRALHMAAGRPRIRAPGSPIIRRKSR